MTPRDAARGGARTAHPRGVHRSTWKQLVQSLHIVLTGRAWLIKGSVLLTLTFLILLGPIVEWIIDSPSAQRRVVERAALDPGRSGWPEDVRCRLDRDAPRSQPAARRSRARRRRRLLVCRRARALWRARVVFLHALRRPLPARARRDPGGSSRATVGGAAGARVESAPVTTAKRRGSVLAAVLVLISLPVVLALIEAVSFCVANRSNGSFVSSGQKREYLLYVPRSYDSSKPTALVISLHGAGLWGAAQKETSQWNRVADEHGFIVVYPSGAGGAGPRVWHEGGEPNRHVMSGSSPS